MVIAICILGGLLFCAIITIFALWYALNVVLNDYIEKNPQEVISYYLDQETEERYPCTLLMMMKENAGFDGSVYDFSQYEEKNIIGLIGCKKEGTKHTEDDEEPQIALIPGQTVCKMKDGSYQWDFRGLM
jgi:hypothetical protein